MLLDGNVRCFSMSIAGTDIMGIRITMKNFVKIRGFLEQILKELETTGAKRVVTRFNSSDSIKPAPYFIGIVEDSELVKRRTAWNEPDAGLFGSVTTIRPRCTTKPFLIRQER